MRRIWFGIVLAAAALGACGDDDDVSTQPDELWGRTFLSSDVTRDLVAGTTIRLEFIDGEVRANAGCNHLMGTASIDGDRLMVANVGGTEMGCDAERHAQDEWLTMFLGRQPKWTLDGATLTLDDTTDTIVLVDREVADPDRPLEGTRWVVDSIVDGDSVSSVPGAPEVEATMTFADGVVSGSNGCNQFSGDAVITDGTVELGLLVQTYKACDPPASAVEGAVNAVLRGTVSFEIEAGQLTLTAADGRGLILRAVA